MRSRFVVLLTGHPGAGKSTLARPLARALHAVCLSKDQVRYRVFDGWKPDHPVFQGEALSVGDATFDEDQVVWGIYFWAIGEAVAVAPVVAETAMTRSRNRDEMREFITSLDVPAFEVVLRVPLPVLVDRYAARQASPDTHRVYRTFPPGCENSLLTQTYEPLLSQRNVIEVDATDPGTIDVENLAGEITRRIAATNSSEAPPA